MKDNRFFGVPARDWLWLLILALVRVAIGLRYGLGVDEAHYALYGVHLDWSYFDHPPLIGWIESLFLHLLGRRDWVVHLSAEIIGLVSGVMAFRYAENLTGDKRAARWAALALCVTFLPNGVWLLVVPDTLLLILVFWLFEVIQRLEKSEFQNPKIWCEMGLCIGLCGLAKYTAVILLPSLVGYFIFEKEWRAFRSRWIFVAIAIAALVVSPVFYWNATHNWISFQYQVLHVVHAHRLSALKMLSNLGQFCAVQIVAYSPFAIAAAAIGWWLKRRSLSRLARLTLWVSLPCLGFFAYTAAREPGLPHWTLYAWGVWIPAGVALAMSSPFQKLTGRLVLASLVILCALFFELAFHVIRYPPYHSPYNDFAGWQELGPQIKKALQADTNSNVSIAVPNWTLGSRANWYYSDLAPVYVLDDRFDQFDLWEQRLRNQTPDGKDVLVLQWRGFKLSDRQRAHCQTVEDIGTKIFAEHNRPITSVDLFWCRHYNEARK